MKDQSFSTKSGLKVRTIEAEASGGLVELDMNAVQKTAEGTWLIPSKDLQAAGKWALTVEVAEAKAAGKPVPPEIEKDLDKTTMFLNDLMQKLPTLLKVFNDIKNDRVHPVQKGLEKGVMDAAVEVTREILEGDEELKAALREQLQMHIEKFLGFTHDEPSGEEGS